ncbi:MAG: hypothetical protein JSV25_14940 [Spirochaetota bacterium]|nr:MAG: hypothetical protein JSV25_14940 [Spirochaetota bacterium]
MVDHDAFEQAKLKLEGRIYPAIQRCVSNRYRILMGVLTYYGFIARTGFYEKLIGDPYRVSWVVSIAFSLLAGINSLNYILNAWEQYGAEARIISFEELHPKWHAFRIEPLISALLILAIWASRWAFYGVWFFPDP